MSMKASVSASSKSLKHGTAPATILQKMHSGSLAIGPPHLTSGPPERLVAFVLAVGWGQPDIQQHPRRHPRQLAPGLGAPTPLGQTNTQPHQPAECGFN